MSERDWTSCPECGEIAFVEWDLHTHESTNGPVAHGVGRCLHGHWWNVWGDAWTVLSGEEA